MSQPTIRALAEKFVKDYDEGHPRFWHHQAEAFRAALRAGGQPPSDGMPQWAREIAAVDLWQFNDQMHPLTCGNDSGHKNLIPALVYGKAVLLCPECNYLQHRIPDVVLAYAAEPPLSHPNRRSRP